MGRLLDFATNGSRLGREIAAQALLRHPADVAVGPDRAQGFREPERGLSHEPIESFDG